jgi:AcrR family transcriptional regulator
LGNLNLVQQENVKPTFLNLSPEKQERILDAATKEFAEKGFARASINSIVGAVGIAKGSIYQYFPDKERLFLYTFETAVQLIRARLKEVKHEVSSADFFDRVRRTLLAGLEFTRRHPRIYQAYLRVMFEGGVPFRAELTRRIRAHSLDYLTGLVKEGIERGDIRSDASPEKIAFFLDAVMDRFLQARVAPEIDAGLRRASKAELEAWASEFVQLLRLGLAREGS